MQSIDVMFWPVYAFFAMHVFFFEQHALQKLMQGERNALIHRRSVSWY